MSGRVKAEQDRILRFDWETRVVEAADVATAYLARTARSSAIVGPKGFAGR